MQKVSIIVAMGANREIGKNNDLMWHLPVDMRFFKDKTLGHPVIMGRKNYESIPEKYRPFKDRLNIVVSSQADYLAPGCILFQDLTAAASYAQQQDAEEVFIIGGGQIYAEALRLKMVNTMYITHIESTFPDAHTFFPAFEASEWERQLLFTQSQDEKHAMAFSTYQYTKKV